jgi:hypothetical protein
LWSSKSDSVPDPDSLEMLDPDPYPYPGPQYWCWEKGTERPFTGYKITDDKVVFADYLYEELPSSRFRTH